MPSPVILFNNQLIFIGPAFKICKLDRKRWLIKNLLTSLIKNENLLKIYLFEFNVEKRHYFPVPLILKTKHSSRQKLNLDLTLDWFSMRFSMSSLFSQILYYLLTHPRLPCTPLPRGRWILSNCGIQQHNSLVYPIPKVDITAHYSNTCLKYLFSNFKLGTDVHCQKHIHEVYFNSTHNFVDFPMIP